MRRRRRAKSRRASSSAQAETEIAALFEEAAKSYQNNPTALHLRAMNMLYEGLKEKGALMLIPSSAVESMGMGGLMGAAALAQQQLTTKSEQPRSEEGDMNRIRRTGRPGSCARCSPLSAQLGVLWGWCRVVC